MVQGQARTKRSEVRSNMSIKTTVREGVCLPPSHSVLTQVSVMRHAPAMSLRPIRVRPGGPGRELSPSGERGDVIQSRKAASPSLSGMSCDAHSGSHTFSANTLEYSKKSPFSTTTNDDNVHHARSYQKRRPIKMTVKNNGMFDFFHSIKLPGKHPMPRIRLGYFAFSEDAFSKGQRSGIVLGGY